MEFNYPVCHKFFIFYNDTKETFNFYKVLWEHSNMKPCQTLGTGVSEVRWSKDLDTSHLLTRDYFDGHILTVEVGNK